MKQLYSLKLNGKSRSQLEALFPQFISNEDSLPSIADIVDYFSLSQVQSRPVSSVLAQLSQSELHSPERNIHQAPPVEVPDTAFLRKSARQVLSEIPPEELDPSRSELIKIIESIKSLEKEPARLIQAIISVHNIFSILDVSVNFIHLQMPPVHISLLISQLPYRNLLPSISTKNFVAYSPRLRSNFQKLIVCLTREASGPYPLFCVCWRPVAKSTRV